MNPNKKQKIDDYFYPTEFQRARQRMVARYNRTDIPEDIISEIQSFATYKPFTEQKFNEKLQSYSIGDGGHNYYPAYVRDFNNTRIPKNRENFVLNHLENFINKNFNNLI